MPKSPSEIKDRILANSIPIPFVGCWLWLRRLNIDGYAEIKYKRKASRASRVSFAAFNAPIPNGLIIRHTCDNRWCVNPDHLILGTQQQNTDDMVHRDRQRKNHAKLTPEQVDDVRQRSQNGESQRSIARQYNVTQAAIFYMIHNVRYHDRKSAKN